MRKIKKALSARRLFNNWYSLLVKYALNRIGFHVKLKAKIDKCYFNIDPNVFARIVSRISHIPIKSVICVGEKLLINGIEVDDLNNVIKNHEFWAKLTGWKYDEKCHCWVKDGVKFRHIYDMILRVFGSYGEPQYGFLNVNGKIVVDVGAYVGDTAIYFALRGAKKIIAIEPHPEAFKEMLDNIKLNNLANRIIPINAGLASKPGSICIKSVDVEETVGVYHNFGECDTPIPVITLADVINQYHINDNAILKMNCEGCEFDIIFYSYEHVKVFKEVVFEYHLHQTGNSLSKLLKILNKDYHCKVIEKVVLCVR